MPSNKVSTSTPQTENKSEVNDELANGPIEERSCRDVLCCLLFIAFCGGLIAVAAYGISAGNPNLLGRGYDSDSKMCGISSGYENYPYVYFAIPMAGYLTNTICLASCPDSSSATTVDCKTNSVHTTCVTQKSSAPYPQTDIWPYETISFANRICVPAKIVSEASDASSTILNASMFEEWISDIKSTWQVIAVSVAVAFIIGLIYMVLLRYCSGVLTWLAILAFIIGQGILGWRFYAHAQDLQNSADATSSDSDSNIQKTIKTDKIIAYILWGSAGLTLLIVLCMFSRIRLAIAILKAAADYVKETLIVFLVPIVAVIILAAFLAYWAVTAVYLVSAGDPSKMSTTPFGTFSYNKKLQYYMIYHLFGLLWVCAFIAASVQFIIASSTCIWYFSQGTGQGATGTVRKSVWRLFRYHFGSIAFGSLILAIVQMIRIILAYIQRQVEKSGGAESKIAKFFFGCLQCYLACFERFIKFLNKNAYIQIALSGKNFCFAAKDGFMLTLNNPLRISVLYGITGIFVFMGKVFIAALTALAAFLTITRWSKFSDQIYSPVIPTIIIAIFAYGIGNCFMTVYGMAAETILACFVLDEEINKKKNAPPRHCPESLKGFLDMHEKKNN